VNLHPHDVDEALVSSAKFTYLEGYLYDPPHAQEAFRKAAAIARGAGRKVALSLSDSFCVVRHREAFLDLLRSVDVLFANEAEICALFETEDFDAAVELARGQAPLTAVTRGAQGAVIVSAFETVAVPAAPVERVVDTTGAGDLFAAGFLYGLTRDLPLAECGRLGTVAAAEIISHYGGRPETPLSAYVAAG
jgi:sugar/nucleoside kinase (ribokinase family)